MKILYIGSIMTQEMVDEVTMKSRKKPSIAPVNFQRNLLKGFSKQEIQMDILSLPPIAMFPNSRYVGWGAKKEIFASSFKSRYIPVINLPLLKQICTLVSSLVMILGWCLKNVREKEKCVLVYGQNLYIALAQIALCKIFRIKSCNIVTDPINYVSNYDAMSKVKKIALKIQWSLMNAIKRGYTSYVLLTEPMVKDYIQNEEPYIILEGVGDTSIFDGLTKTEKVSPPAIMYAGALTEGFGIKKLLSAFQQVEGNCQLWLFGDGDCKEDVQKLSLVDARVKYWGKVPWKELLEHMREARALLSVKPIDEFHSSYQFPSKIMEYMASGTVTLSTKVKGIPTEYFYYIYPIEDTIDGIKEGIEAVLSKKEAELSTKGEKAKEFVAQYKNCYVQAERVIQLLQETL